MFILCAAFLSISVQAEKAVNWRIFRASDGLKDSHVTAVTLSPRGNVWVKHGDSDEISVFDGYAFRTVPSPGRDSFRVYESRTGRQLWSLTTNGLVIFDGSQWVQHPIPAIRDEIQSDPLRQIRQIPLVPVQQDRAFFLLSNHLMEYDAARRQTTSLKRVGDTGLGKFLEMTEIRKAGKSGEGGLWITGTKGVAKVSSAVRQIHENTAWEVQALSDRLRLENLQRPFEDDQGGVTTAAMDTDGPNKRVILQSDGSSWRKHFVEGETIRQAWPGWDRSVWAYTINSLIRFDGQAALIPSRQPVWLGQFNDVAPETNGVFWLGTTEGLVRCAPDLWRTPPMSESVDSLAHAAMQDAEGALWFASTEALIRLQDGHSRKFKWPENFDADFQPTDALFPLRDGRIAVAANTRALVFDPRAERFDAVVHPVRRGVRLIGSSKDGMIWAQTGDGNLSLGDSFSLEKFDGDNFVPGIEPSPDWGMPGELYFAHEMPDGDLWLGGSGGISLWRNGKFQTFGPAHSYPEGKALCLLELPDGKFWCGGSEKISEFDGKGWTTLRTGLDRVTCMTRGRDGRIRLATSSGLYTYFDGSWVMNGIEEGLPSASISEVFEDRSGRIWAGTARGLSLFHPNADRHPPKTLAARVDSPRQLSTEGPVTVEFAAVDKWRYTPAERLLFSYRLDEGQWSPYTNAAIQAFGNLRAGRHRVEVRAMDRNWNADPGFSFVDFSIVVPWFREPRVIGTLVVGLVLVVFFAWLAVNRHLQLIRSYAEVEQIVTLRTRELERANQELLQSQKMKALGTLAAGIAHDFNNILSIIKGSAQIIESHLDDKEKIRTRVDRIKTVVEQGSGIVKSMLGLSRVTEQNLVRCDPVAMVEDTLKILGDRFLQEISVRVEAGHSVPSILGAKELIQQMLLNLILNGADAMMGKGEMVVRVGQADKLPSGMALQPSQADGFVYLAVQDFGSGVDPDVLPRIFEPFFTTKAFSTRRGTGLGLSMVYEIAKQMGYGLGVETAVGQGSTMTIFIPVKAA